MNLIRLLITTVTIVFASLSVASAKDINFARLKDGCSQLKTLKTFDCRQRVDQIKLKHDLIYSKPTAAEQKALSKQLNYNADVDAFIADYKSVVLYGLND